MNTAEALLRQYVTKNNVTVDMEKVTKRGIFIVQECQKNCDQLRKDLGLPHMLATTVPPWKKTQKYCQQSRV